MNITFESALRDAMFSAALPFDGHFDFSPQKYHTFNSAGLCKKKCCRYRIFENQVGAHFICWRRDINVTWFYKEYESLSIEQKSKFNKERQESLDLKEKIRQEATLLAREQWWCSEELNPEHDYVRRKRIIPYYARAHKNAVLLPVYNWQGEIQSLQKIYPDGAKRFATKAPMSGGILIISEVITPKILVCEGWATGCSLYEASGLMTVVAYSASNMPSTGGFLKRRCKDSRVIYCADRDKHGVGQKNAIAAAKMHGGVVILPNFLEQDSELTDFNDVAVKYGLDNLTEQLSI